MKKDTKKSLTDRMDDFKVKAHILKDKAQSFYIGATHTMIQMNALLGETPSAYLDFIHTRDRLAWDNRESPYRFGRNITKAGFIALGIYVNTLV